mmetsp:Transcript_1317/g.3977  ORF Transcript_1317/g.3977 Transcript_1317/m.3977 type:complete len:374 (-) Transcript_1317:546-1667(-)
MRTTASEIDLEAQPACGRVGNPDDLPLHAQPRAGIPIGVDEAHAGADSSAVRIEDAPHILRVGDHILEGTWRQQMDVIAGCRGWVLRPCQWIGAAVPAVAPAAVVAAIAAASWCSCRHRGCRKGRQVRGQHAGGPGEVARGPRSDDDGGLGLCCVRLMRAQNVRGLLGQAQRLPLDVVVRASKTVDHAGAAAATAVTAAAAADATVGTLQEAAVLVWSGSEQLRCLRRRGVPEVPHGSKLREQGCFNRRGVRLVPQTPGAVHLCDRQTGEIEQGCLHRPQRRRLGLAGRGRVQRSPHTTAGCRTPPPLRDAAVEGCEHLASARLRAAALAGTPSGDRRRGRRFRRRLPAPPAVLAPDSVDFLECSGPLRMPPQ